MNARRAHGYSLLELAIGLVVLGLIIVLVWQFGKLTGQRLTEIRAPQTLGFIDQALTGFIAATHRLPCPDSTGTGVEDCTGGAAVGRLPVVTLGLARADLANVRYGVYRAANAIPPQDADLAVALDRFWPNLPEAIPLVTPAIRSIPLPMPIVPVTGPPIGVGLKANLEINGIDFCAALLTGQGQTTILPGALKLQDSAGIAIRHVAYAVALPGARDADGDGNLFDGPNTVANAFAAPTQPMSSTYDDTVLAVDFGQLFDRLACGSTLAAASHAQANAATTAAIAYAKSVDYRTQVELSDNMAWVNKLFAQAQVVSAAAGLASSIANMATAVSIVTSSLGSAGALIGLASAGIALNTAAVISTALKVDSADAHAQQVDCLLARSAHSDCDTSIPEYGPVMTSFGSLAASTRLDACVVDQAGNFPNPPSCPYYPDCGPTRLAVVCNYP